MVDTPFNKFSNRKPKPSYKRCKSEDDNTIKFALYLDQTIGEWGYYETEKHNATENDILNRLTRNDYLSGKTIESSELVDSEIKLIARVLQA